MASKPTKEKILDAAEALLAEHGLAGASMRAITTGAEVNLASVNYHFGSKEALIQAVFARRLGPVNRERMELLDALESAGGDSPPTLEGIVEAFLQPALQLRRRHAEDWHVLRRLLGHTMSLPSGNLREMFLDQFSDVVQRFTDAIGRALPDLTPQEVLWRFLFMVGALVHSLAMAEDMPRISRGLCDDADVERISERLVPFVAAGLRAPAPTDDLGTKHA